MNDEHVNCASCGPKPLAAKRLEDHGSFYCPNGHSNHWPGKTEQEKKIERLERWTATLEQENRDLYSQREDLIAALKECPIPGCSYRSRKQIPRDPVNMGRGIERVRHDLLEHLVRDHAGQASREPLLLPAGSDG